MSNHIHHHEDGWYFSDEAEFENGPYPTEEKAKQELTYYVDHLTGRISPFDWADGIIEKKP